MGTLSVGVYGIPLVGLPGARDLLRPVREERPTYAIRRRRAPTTLTTASLDEHRLAHHLPSADVDVVVERAARTVTLTAPDEHPDAAVVHPFLALTGAVVARWAGRDAFHAGVFVHEGGAWVVLGSREAGKSSLVAQLHLMGVPVISDDVAVVADGHVLGGPASIDLRWSAAQHLGIGEAMGVVGSRDRWRVPLPNDEASAPLAGFVLPRWGVAPQVLPVPVAARLPLLSTSVSLRLPPPDPRRFFDLAALPFLELRRPRDWSVAEDAAHLLLGAISARTPRAA